MANPAHVLEFASKLMKVVADDLADYARDIAILGAEATHAEFVNAFSELTEASSTWTKLTSELGAAIQEKLGDETLARAHGVVAATHRVATVHGHFRGVERRMHERFPLFYRHRA